MTAFTFIHGDTTQWVAVLIDAAAKGLVVLLLAGGATLLLRRSSAAVRHMTWTLSIAALILVPFLSLALPQLQVPLLPDWAGTGGLARVEQTAAQPPAVVELPVGTGGPGAESVMPAGDWPSPAGARQPVHPADAAAETPAAPVPAAAAPQTPPVHWSAWVLLAWLAGAAALLLPLLAGTIIVWRQARRAERITSGSWVHLLDELRPRLGVRGRIVLLRSNWPNIPLTCGILHPAIILPAEADDWPADRRRVVLLHELAHIRRRDCLTQLLARLARVIYWFNPLVWLAGRMLRIEREQACDDLVLASGHKASDYAGHLLEIVGSLHSVRCPSLAAVAMARKSQFEGRLLAILDPRRNRRSLTRWGLLIAVLLAVAVAIPLAILRAAESSKPDIQQNISQLQSNDESVWKPAVGKLIAIGPSVAEPLAELFAKGGPGDAHAMQVLEGMATNPDVQALMRKGLDSKSPNVVHCSMLILGKSGNQEHAKTIAALLEKNTIAACIALSELGGEEAFQALVSALNKPNIEPRWLVVEHLARLGKPGAIPGIKEALTHLTGEELATAQRYVAAIHKLEGDGSRPGLTSFSSFHAMGDRNWRVLQGINLDKMDMVYIEPFKPEATPEGTRIKAYQALTAKEGLDLAWDQSEGNRLLAVNGLKLAPYAPALPNGYDVWSDGERLLDQKQLVSIVEQYGASGRIPEVGERVRAHPFKNGDYFLASLPDGRVAIIRTADVWTKDENVCVRLAAKVLDPLYQLIPATAFAAKAAKLTTQPASRPAIGIYIVTDHPKGIPFEKTPLADFTLAAEPLVSEADIFTYDWGTHTIRVNRQAVADRVLNRKGPGGHFVVVVDGQRLYRGAMVSMLTSIVPSVPIINVGLTADQWQPKFAIRIYPPPGDAADPRSDDRLKRALLALNKLSNTVDRSPSTQPAQEQPADESPLGPAIERDAAAVEGALKWGEDLAVEMKPVTAGTTDTDLRADRVRFDAKDDGIAARVRLIRKETGVFGHGWWKVRVEMLLEDGRVYDRREISVPSSAMKIVADCLTWEVEIPFKKGDKGAPKYRLSIFGMDFSELKQAVEGAFALDKPIETELTTYSAGKPDLMRCKTIRFVKDEESGLLGASVWSERGGCRQLPCALRVELFDAAGKSLGYTERVFGAQPGGPSAASGITEELYLSLGTAARFANASRFRLSLRPVSTPALGALEGVLELDHYFAGRIVYEVNVRHGEESSFLLSLPISFETDPNGIVLAKVDVKWPPVQDATYRVRVELLDSAGQVVKTALAPFSTRNDPKWRPRRSNTIQFAKEDSLRLDLGPRKDLAGAVGFRVSLLADEKKADATAPATQPVGSKLEFRIAPTASSLTNAERDSYMQILKGGHIGFWWYYTDITGSMPDHAWLAFAGDMANVGNMVMGEYKGQKYVLVSDKPGQTMVTGEGKEAWGLAKAYATTDAMNRPAVGFEMDDRGAELFSAFTKANIGNVVAIVVDGKVISVPVIRAALGKQGTIPGQFSEQEVKALVQALKAGMPASGPATTQPGGKDQVFLPAGSLDVRRERLLWRAGGTPAVQVDIRNSGMERFFITRTPDGYEVEIDGRWYHWAPDRSEAPKYTRLVKNAGAGDIRLLLDRSWQSKVDGTQLDFRTGVHKLRVGAICRRTPDASAESHTIVSGASQVIIESPAVDDPNDPEGFRRELLLAKEAGDAIEKVRHLHKARQYRPQPDDIELEYGVATYLDNFAGGRGREEREAMWGEARDLLQHIIDTYDHMRYYTTSGPDIPRGPEVLLPGSAVMLGYRRGDPKLCYQAMVWLKQTNDRRIKDWLEAPEPIFDPNNPFTEGVVARSKWQSRVANWRKRKEDAAAGNALNGVESQLAAEAVRAYVKGFGPQEGADALRRIIRDFPRTAMARLAAQQLELATGQAPAIKATDQPSQVDWGAAENGLRCRWVQPKGAFASGTAPEVSAEVDNQGPTPVIWQCTMQGIWQLRIAGVWREDWEKPSFDIQKIRGVRHATAGEVRQAFGNRTTSAPDEQACDGYYRVEAGGRLKVTTTLPWKLTSPGAYRLECRFIRSFMSLGGQLTFISCPPLVLRVTNAESPTQPAWGELVEGFAVRIRPAEPLLRPDGWPGFLVDFRNAAKRKIDVVFAPESIRFEVDGVWYRPTAIALGEVPAFSMGPGEDHLNVPFWPAVHWAWRSPDGEILPTIKPGKHTFRLAFSGLPKPRGEKRPVEVFSQVLEALIPGPATQPAPLGPAKSEDEKAVADLAGRFVKAVMSEDRQAALSLTASMPGAGTTQPAEPSAEKTFQRIWDKAPEYRNLYQAHAELLRAPKHCGVLGNMAFAAYASPASTDDVLAVAIMRQGEKWTVVDLAVTKLKDISLRQSVHIGSATYGGGTVMVTSVGTATMSSAGPTTLPALGSPIERIVAYTQGFPSQAVQHSGAMFLDLDTGSYLKFGRLPDSGTIRKSGVDICYERSADEAAGPRLATSGMQMQPLSKETGWQSDLKTVRHALMVASPYALTLSETAPLAFSTGDGGIGILQIVGVADNPARVTIRYKLLQAGPAPATQPATQPAWSETTQKAAEALRKDAAHFSLELRAAMWSQEGVGRLGNRAIVTDTVLLLSVLEEKVKGQSRARVVDKVHALKIIDLLTEQGWLEARQSYKPAAKEPYWVLKFGGTEPVQTSLRAGDPNAVRLLKTIRDLLGKDDGAAVDEAINSGMRTATQPAPTDTEAQEFYIIGEVERSGVYSLGGRRITVKMALAAAGFALGKKKDMAVVLIRRLNDSSEQQVVLNVDALIAGGQQDVLLRKGDVVVVQPAKDVLDDNAKWGAPRPALNPTASSQPADTASPSATTAKALGLDGDAGQEVPPHAVQPAKADLFYGRDEKPGGAVTILGGVNRSGKYSIDPNGTRIADALAKAGDVSQVLIRYAYVVRQAAGGKTTTVAVDLPKLMDGDPRVNVVLRDGDTVFVPPVVPGEFYVMGEVDRPGVYSLTGRKINVKMALAAAGFPLGKKRDMIVVLVRRKGDGSEQRQTLNVDAILAGAEQDIVLQRDDLLMVRPAKEPATSTSSGQTTNEGARIKLGSFWQAALDIHEGEVRLRLKDAAGKISTLRYSQIVLDSAAGIRATTGPGPSASAGQADGATKDRLEVTSAAIAVIDVHAGNIRVRCGGRTLEAAEIILGPAKTEATTRPAALNWGKGTVRIQDANSVIEGKRITIEDGHMQVEGNAILKANNGAEVKADRIDIRPNAAATRPAHSTASGQPPNGTSTQPGGKISVE